jgi:hypothetical protein
MTVSAILTDFKKRQAWDKRVRTLSLTPFRA